MEEMENMENTETMEAEETAEPEKKRRGGRKPWTEEQKQEAAKRRAERKAQSENMNPVVMVQYQDVEADVDALVEAAKAEFKAAKKRVPVTALDLYIKPEERAAYYVINGEFDGKITF